MELKQYRTCNGCRANAGARCELGFKTDGVKIDVMWGLYAIKSPLEPCPKPKTIMQLIRVEEEMQRANGCKFYKNEVEY